MRKFMDPIMKIILMIIIKNEINEPEEEEINTNKKQLYNNSDNIKQIFNQIDENKNVDAKNKEDIKKENNDNNEVKNDEEDNSNKIIDINEINLDISNNENNENNDNNNNDNLNNNIENKEDEKKNSNNEDNDIDINKEKEIKEKDIKHIEYDNKNKYLQNINLFPEKEIPEDAEALYKLTTLINSEDEDNNDNNINNDIFINKKNKNKQIPIQLIIKEFFHDIIIKQNAITNQTFVLMLKNKFGLMHHFDFFNSIILCNKGNLILQYIELIFDFKTLTLNTSDPDYLTNELRSLVKAEYENNIKCLYLNSLLESLKFTRLSDLNLNYAINNLELNFKLEYAAAPPVDVIFNSSNNDSYDKIFKKLLKYNIYNQIGVKIYQMIKTSKNNNIKKNNKKKMKYSEFNDDDNEEEETINI